MSSGSSDSESISKCEFEATSESDKEFIGGCYNNQSKYSQEEIDKMKERNGSVSEKEGPKEDDTRLGNTRCTCKNRKFYEKMNTESCRSCQEDALLLGGKVENIECVTQNADFPILYLSKTVLQTAWHFGIYKQISKSTLPLISSYFNLLCTLWARGNKSFSGLHSPNVYSCSLSEQN